MPRENSFTDSEGRSLTPDMEDEFRNNDAEQAGVEAPASPTYQSRPSHSSARPVQALASASKRSLHSRVTHATHATANPPQRAPIHKFRAAVRKLVAMHRGTAVLSNGGRVGAEPGVDPRRASADVLYSHIKEDCVIEVADYSSVRSSFGRMTNLEFVNLMDDAAASEREPWVKVRWINIGGISWDVIKAVSLRYNLHPLALEDVFHTRSGNRSKADYYSRHLFLRVLVHELGDPDAIIDPTRAPAHGSTLTGAPRSSSPEPIFENGKMEANDAEMAMMEEEGTVYGSSPNSRKSTARQRRRQPLLPNSKNDIQTTLPTKGTGSQSLLTKLLGEQLGLEAAQQKREEHEVTLEALKKGERVAVNVSPMFIFLFRDGTVISMHSTPDLDLTAPITRRLRQRDTVLRTSADPSLLVQALLDLTVDKALEVIDEYHTKINKFERAILLKPSIKTVRYLHILSGDLILHKRTMEPIKTMIYGLRRYDLDRCAALVDMADPKNADVKVVGFMSHRAKIYLADVFDHMEYILTSLDMFAGISENLIDYTFNLSSYEMNEVMRRLTLATIIFLPLTLLTGYFGMNFDPMWSVQQNSDVLFWYIAIPVMAIVIPAFTGPDIMRLFHYIQKKMLTKQVRKTYKRA